MTQSDKTANVTTPYICTLCAMRCARCDLIMVLLRSWSSRLGGEEEWVKLLQNIKKLGLVIGHILVRIVWIVV